MVGAILLAAAATLCAQPENVQARERIEAERAQKWALVVGINRYDSEDIRALRYAVADARAIHGLLTDPNQGGFSASRTKLLVDGGELPPTRSNILHQIVQLEQHVGAEDTVLFYFSGHGIEHEGHPMLLPSDAHFALLEDTGIPLSRIERLKRVTGCRVLVAILDACRSGAHRDGARSGRMTEAFLQALGMTEGTAVLFSADLDQVAFEDEAAGHGAYTRFLVEALSGAADAAPYGNEDGVVSVSEAHNYVSARLREWGFQHNRMQTPRLDLNDTEEILLTLASAAPAVSAPPAQAPTAERPWEFPGTHAGQEIVGPASIPLVWVPGGSFIMGSTEAERTRLIDAGVRREFIDGEGPAHRVEMSGFWIGKTEVTVAQWRSVMGGVPEENDQGDDHPVVNVTWNACMQFCARTGLELPTEAQWEYAARGPESLTHPWGNAWDPNALCWRENRGPGGRTFPVGSFPSGASWCGALDMLGNAWEWCADLYAEDYYANSPPKDPPGPTTGTRGDQRVLRGGSWQRSENFCRSAYRDWSGPDGSDNNYGFRVVFSPSHSQAQRLPTPAPAPDPAAPQPDMSPLERGRLLAGERDYQGAIAAYTEAIAADPDSVDAYFGRALAHTRLDNDEAAIADYTRILRVNPDHGGSLVNRSVRYRSLGNLGPALEDIERFLGLAPHAPMGYLHRGMVYLALDRNEDALRDLQRTLELDPDGRLGRAASRELEARGWPATERPQDPAAPQPDMPPLERGRLLAGERDYQGAIAAYTEAIAADPDSVEPYFGRALAHAALGNAQAALADYTSALRLNPDHAPSLVNRSVLHRRLGNPGPALEDIERFLASGHNAPMGHYNRGMVYIALNRNEDALRDLQRALQLDPDGRFGGMATRELEARGWPLR